MTRVLHLIKDPDNRTALDVVARHARDPGISLSVVLLHAAGRLTERLPGEVFRLVESPTDGGNASLYAPIDHARLLEMIFDADTVITW